MPNFYSQKLIKQLPLVDLMSRKFKRFRWLIFPGICCFAFILPANAVGGDTALQFESLNRNVNYLDFKDKDDLQPVKSAFSMVEYSLMSNPQGDRWALVTVKNKTAKQEKISDDNFVAVFADGERRNASKFFELVAPNGRLTEAIYFGKSNFPIILISMEKLP